MTKPNLRRTACGKYTLRDGWMDLRAGRFTPEHIAQNNIPPVLRYEAGILFAYVRPAGDGAPHPWEYSVHYAGHTVADKRGYGRTIGVAQRYAEIALSSRLARYRRLVYGP